MTNGIITSIIGNQATGQLPNGQFFSAPIIVDQTGILRVDLSTVPPVSAPIVTDEMGQEAKENMFSAGKPDPDAD